MAISGACAESSRPSRWLPQADHGSSLDGTSPQHAERLRTGIRRPLCSSTVGAPDLTRPLARSGCYREVDPHRPSGDLPNCTEAERPKVGRAAHPLRASRCRQQARGDTAASCDRCDARRRIQRFCIHGLRRVLTQQRVLPDCSAGDTVTCDGAERSPPTARRAQSTTRPRARSAPHTCQRQAPCQRLCHGAKSATRLQNPL